MNSQKRPITSNTDLFHKDILTAPEAAEYMSMSLSHLYYCTSNRLVKHFKFGKCLRFKREDLNEFLLAKPIETLETISNRMKTS